MHDDEEEDAPMATTKMLYTIPEAADLTGIGRTTLYGEITAGRLESIKIGRARRIPADALTDFVARLRQEARDDAGDAA